MNSMVLAKHSEETTNTTQSSCTKKIVIGKCFEERTRKICFCKGCERMENRNERKWMKILSFFSLFICKQSKFSCERALNLNLKREYNVAKFIHSRFSSLFLMISIFEAFLLKSSSSIVKLEIVE